jgi:DNA-directed RNA polymerase beta' subunit
MARVGPSYRVGDEDGDLSHLVFSVLSAEEKRALSVCEIFDPRAWTNNFPCNNGPHDQRMGSTNRSLVCPTCHETNCHGHPGRIEFAEPVYHVLMLKILAKLFRCVCIFCAQPRFLIKHEPCKGYEPVECEGKVLYIERKLALLRGRDPKQCLKTLSAFLDKRDCVNPECKMPQPKIKSTALELEHAYSSLVLKKMPRQAQEAMRRPLSSFEYRSILKHVPHDAYLVLGFRPSVSHPSDMIMENFLVPPPGVRPPLRLQEGAKTKSEHDMTKFIVAILHANNELTQLKTDGSARDKLYLAWQMLQLQVSRFIAFKKVKKVKLRGMERDKRKQAQTVPQDMEKILAGKQGRFRKNLSGKRCNRSARAPVAPDVQRDVWELGVPRQMFTTLTVPTRVTAFNLSEMQESVRKGEGVLGGAESVREPDPSFQSKEITHSLSNKTSE